MRSNRSLKRRNSCTIVALLMPLLAVPSAASADVVLDWNAIAVAALSNQNPFNQARSAAVVQAAVFEAVNAVTREYEPYLGSITAPVGASAEAAAIAAAYRVLVTYAPASAEMLDTARTAGLGAIPDGPEKQDGIATGDAAAAAMMALRENDGSAAFELYAPASSAAGEWQLTPMCTLGGGLFLHWRTVSPFAITHPADFRAPAPPALASEAYAKDYEEVKQVGGANSVDRPQDRALVASFFAVTSGTVVWNAAARQAAAAQGRSLSHNARSLAVLNMAINDALVASFESKYHYRLWRPETAIREADIDGNPKTGADPSFTPLVITPCFPSYPSAHASSAYAALEVLTRIYEGGGHSLLLSNPRIPGVSLSYSRFRAIAMDIDDARVYGGIHFRFDQDGGATQGRAIGAYVIKNVLRSAIAVE